MKNEPDQIDMMSEEELRSELRNALKNLEAQTKRAKELQEESTAFQIALNSLRENLRNQDPDLFKLGFSIAQWYLYVQVARETKVAFEKRR